MVTVGSTVFHYCINLRRIEPKILFSPLPLSKLKARGMYLNNTCILIIRHISQYHYRPVKENSEALVVPTKEIGLEVNADKTKYMVMSRDRNAGRGYSVKTDNTSIERVEEFKYLGTTLTHQNSIQEEIKSRLKLGNACYHLVQNILSSSFCYLKI